MINCGRKSHQHDDVIFQIRLSYSLPRCESQVNAKLSKVILGTGEQNHYPGKGGQAIALGVTQESISTRRGLNSQISC